MTGKFNNTNCDKLWRVWYAVLISALQIFLIYVGISRYLTFKSQAFDARYGGEWDQAGLNFTLAMLISAMTFFSFFLIVSFLRTDNYANEGTQIGRDTDNLQIITSASAQNISAPTWRSQMPPSFFGVQHTHLRNCNNGQLGATLQRSCFSPLAEGDDRISNDPVVGDDGVHAVNFDTWSARSNAIVGGNGGLSGINPEMTHFNSYNTSNLFHVNGSAMEPHTRTHATAKQSVGLLWRRLQRHCLPYSDILHVLTAICLLLPIAVVHAQQIYHRVIPFDWIWRSDLDFLVGRENQLHNGPDSSMFQTSSLTRKSPTIDQRGRLTGSSLTSNSESFTITRPGWDDLRAISPEFFNLCLALLLLSLHYPSVFWYTNRSFSFIFSLLLILIGCYIVIEYNAVFVLVKLAWNQHLTISASQTAFGGQSVSEVPLNFISVPHHSFRHSQQSSALSNLPLSQSDVPAGGQEPMSPATVTEPRGGVVNVTPLILSTIGSLIFLSLFVTVFEYGYRQFIDSLSVHRHYLMAAANERTGLLLPSNSILMTQHQQQSDPTLLDSQHQQSQQGYNTADTVERLSSPHHIHRNPPPESMESLVNGSTKSNNYGVAIAGLSPNPGLGNGAVGNVNDNNPSGEGNSYWCSYNIGADLLHPSCRFCLYTCTPRLIALVGCLLVLTFKVPVIIDCLQVYRVTKQSVMLLTPLSCGIAVCAWLIAWFAFSLKPAWKFQVNLPTQAINSNVPLMTSYSLAGPTMGRYPSAVPANCFQTPIISGTLSYNPSGVPYNGGLPISGSMNGNGCLMSHPVGLLSPANLFTNHIDGVDHQQDGRRSINMTMTSGSPVYACFHETPATAAAALGPGIGTSCAGMIDPTTGLPVIPSAGNGVLTGLPNSITGTAGLYPLEYCSEDTEASSGRHSGNNYVCLQSALHSNALVGMTTSPSFNITTESHQQQQQQQATSMLLLNRSLLRSAITSTATAAVSMASPSAIMGCSTQPLPQLSRSSVVGVDGGLVLESSKAAELPGTTVRPDHFKQAGSPGTEVDKDNILADISSKDDGQVNGLSLTRPSYRTDLNYSHGISLGQTMVKPTVSSITSLGSGIATHRMVSFQEESIGGSEKTPKISSATTVIANGLPAPLATPSTFRSTMVFRSPSLNTTIATQVHDHQVSTGASLLTVSSPSLGNSQVGSSFYSRSGIPTTPSLIGGKSNTTPDSGLSQAPGDVHPSGHTAMIGDINNGMLHPTNDEDDERYPLLLPPSLLTGDAQEPRLCSQV